MQAGRSSECRVPVALPLQRVLPAFHPGNASVGTPLLRRSQRSPLSPAWHDLSNPTRVLWSLPAPRRAPPNLTLRPLCLVGAMPSRAVRARVPRHGQASPAAVRSGGPSEARPALPVGSDRAGSGAPAFRCGGWGEPQPGRRALQQRGEPARSGSPRPDGGQTTHTVSSRAS